MNLLPTVKTVVAGLFFYGLIGSVVSLPLMIFSLSSLLPVESPEILITRACASPAIVIGSMVTMIISSLFAGLATAIFASSYPILHALLVGCIVSVGTILYNFNLGVECFWWISLAMIPVALAGGFIATLIKRS